MGINWPGLSMSVGSPNDRVKQLVDECATAIEGELLAAGLPLHSSPLWRPFSFTAFIFEDVVVVAISKLSGGMANVRWLDQNRPFDPLSDLGEAQAALNREANEDVELAFALPLAGTDDDRRNIEKEIALDHVRHIQRSQLFSKLDIVGLEHLEPHLRTFLEDHPDYDRNVFVMMRFSDGAQLAEAHEAIGTALAARGMRALRADDRDYTGDLWTNVQVYMAGSRYGIAIFEDIDHKDFNPNVSMELGYMMGRNKRCLILKEKRLASLPADVVGKLYKQWDAFNIPTTVEAQVGKWVDTDLGLSFI